MTVNYADSAVSKIRSYIWDKLTENQILLERDYIADNFIVPLVPIIPTQQVPEFNNLLGGKTYIVYDFEVSEYYDQWWICQENLILTVVSNDYSKIIEITQYLIDLFRRNDESAEDINVWQDSSSKFRFHTFILKSAMSPTPVAEEGGRQMGTVEITYKYSRNLDSNGRFQ